MSSKTPIIPSTSSVDANLEENQGYHSIDLSGGCSDTSEVQTKFYHDRLFDEQLEVFIWFKTWLEKKYPYLSDIDTIAAFRNIKRFM